MIIDFPHIEQLWDQFGSEIRQRLNHTQASNEFSDALREEWDKIEQVRIQILKTP